MNRAGLAVQKQSFFRHYANFNIARLQKLVENLVMILPFEGISSNVYRVPALFESCIATAGHQKIIHVELRVADNFYFRDF